MALRYDFPDDTIQVRTAFDEKVLVAFHDNVFTGLEFHQFVRARTYRIGVTRMRLHILTIVVDMLGNNLRKRR